MDIVFLDIAKVFDSVNHRLLLHELKTYGLYESVIKWIQSFPDNRIYRIQVNGSGSSEVRASSGVPRSSVLGPILFLQFINDMPEAVGGNVALFADDAKMVACRENLTDLKLSFKNA